MSDEKIQGEQQQNDNGLGQPQLPPIDGELIANENAEAPPQYQGAGLAEMFKMLGANVCAFIASRKGDHWNMSEVEAASFGEAADKVAGLYIKDGVVSPWIGLAIVVGAFAVPRMAYDAHMQKQKEKAKPDDKQPGSN